MKKKVSDIIVDFLDKKGISQVFGVTGGGAMHLNDSFSKNKNIKFTYMHHEQAAAMAADAYFREKLKPAIVHTTSGPGGTNAITGVVGAWIDSIPTMIISGQVPSVQQINNTKTRQIGVQEADIIKMIKSSTKYAQTLTDPNKTYDVLEAAYQKMLEGRPGPVWIDVPLDIQAKKINVVKKRLKTEIKKNFKSNLNLKIKKMLNLIKNSQKPVIVAGNGIHISKSKIQFYKFFKKLKCPIITSWNGSDLINSKNEQYVGRMGLFGDRASNLTAQNSDLLIVLGSRLSVPQIGYITKDFAKNAKKIIVDIDKNELNKNFLSKIELKFNYDLNIFLTKSNYELKRKKKQFNFSRWLKITQKWKVDYPVVDKKNQTKQNKINSFYFIKKLSRFAKSNSSIVTDMGTSFTCTMQTFEIKNHKKQRLFTSSGLAAMGFGLPGAIGASFANPNKEIICITGDGGFMFNIQELQTIKHHNLPVKIFILENQGYLTMQLMQKKNFKKLTGSDVKSGISFPNFKKIAEGFSLDYLKLGKSNIDNQLKKIFSNKKPCIIEVNMPKFQQLVPRVQAQLLKDGSFVNPEFDNLFPYLPKSILEKERLKVKF
jgi:acetolactate synthase I/II/III large subunit